MPLNLNLNLSLPLKLSPLNLNLTLYPNLLPVPFPPVYRLMNSITVARAGRRMEPTMASPATSPEASGVA